MELGGRAEGRADGRAARGARDDVGAGGEGKSGREVSGSGTASGGGDCQ